MKIEVNQNEYQIRDIKTDSRKVKKEDLFIAYKGVDVDAHNYIAQAIENGASLVIGEIPVDQVIGLTDSSSYEQVADGREFWAKACAQKYGYPQNELKIIGITGTDGKTTTINMLYHILNENGLKVGMISTVSAKYGDKDITTGLHTTSPDPDVTFKILRDMVDEGIEYFIMETTSHSLIHKRVFGIKFVACGVTNISSEHLDSHGTYEQLIKDKSLIFRMSESIYLSDTGKGINEIEQYLPEELDDVFRVKIIQGLDKNLPNDFFSRFPGEYNKQNLSLAVALADRLGLNQTQCLDVMSTMPQVTGRYHKVPNKLGIRLIIDFAHTSNSMEEVLNEVNNSNEKGGKIITVFGCAGERDKYKRPIMGKISSELSDIVIVTAEDPRLEKVIDITKEIVSGNPDFNFIEIPDRQKAIKKAIKLAKENDTVIILGKGHEESMNFDGIEYPWSDIEAVKNVLGDDYIF